jgi:hypothetical protein
MDVIRHHPECSLQSDATQRIKSGDRLEVDGDRGTVKVLPPA